MIYLYLLEKQEQAKPKSSRWREKIKTRAEISKTGTEREMQRVNGTKS
jgi:hypothetical protein